MGQQRLAGLSQRHRALIAMKQLLAQLTLEATDLRADGRLSHRHPDRRTRELPLLGDRDKVGKLPEVHSKVL